MGNFWGSLFGLNKNRRSMCILIIGLPDAGKTTVFKRLTKERSAIGPTTLGFLRQIIRRGNDEIELYDLGGNLSWEVYFNFSYGFIFVVDVSAKGTMSKSYERLNTLMKHPNFEGKPILILLNSKNTVTNLDTSCFTTSAVNYSLRHSTKDLANVNKYSDFSKDGIEKGFAWLLKIIESEYDYLKLRVMHDSRGTVQQETQDIQNDLSASQIRHSLSIRRKYPETLKIATLSFPLMEKSLSTEMLVEPPIEIPQVTNTPISKFKEIFIGNHSVKSFKDKFEFDLSDS